MKKKETQRHQIVFDGVEYEKYGMFALNIYSCFLFRLIMFIFLKIDSLIAPLKYAGFNLRFSYDK